MSNPCNVEGVHYPPSICPPHQTTTVVPPAAGTAVTGFEGVPWLVGGSGLIVASVVFAAAARFMDRRGRP